MEEGDCRVAADPRLLLAVRDGHFDNALERYAEVARDVERDETRVSIGWMLRSASPSFYYLNIYSLQVTVKSFYYFTYYK